MAKPATLVADLAHLPAVLVEHLVKLERWCVWRWEERPGKGGTPYWTKVPCQARFPQSEARTNDPRTWARYDEAVAAAVRADGIGFMLCNSDIAAADLDKVRDAHSGDLVGWVKPLVEEALKLSLYVEVTVSGTGLRFIGTATSGNYLHKKFVFNRMTKAGIELYRNCARYITVSGMQQGACKTLGSIDAFLDELVTRFGPQRTRNFNFNNVSQTTTYASDYYRNLIEHGPPPGGDRSEEFHKVVWHLAAAGWSIDQITDELELYPNGMAQKYIGRLYDEVKRCYDKWLAQRHASAVGASCAAPNSSATAMPAPRAGTASVPGGNATSSASAAPSIGSLWPQIRVVPAELPRIVDEAEKALLLLECEIYQRGGFIVRPVLNQSLKASGDRETEMWQLIPVTQPYLVEVLCCAAQFLQFDKRARKFIPTDAPEKVAETYLHRQGRWKLPVIAGIVGAPFLRGDGTICETPGYDIDSHLLYKPDSTVTFPPVPQQPNKGHAIVALEKLRNLISTFPFEDGPSRSVMLAGMLTVLDRRTMQAAPLFGFTSPTAGTGKSLLVDLMNILANGRFMPVMAQGATEEEFEKRLGAKLLTSDGCISVDNCKRPLTGDVLAQALTQNTLSIRVLGFSRNVDTTMNATIFATGNNLEIADDLSRRCLLSSLDAKVERPELRAFAIDLIEHVRDGRADYVIAILTILRAWRLARAKGERVTVSAFGSYTDWSQRVREALIWLGEDDPCKTQEKIRENDPVTDALKLVMIQWQRCLRIGVECTVRDVISRAVNDPDFYNALLFVAANKSGAMVSNDRLGRWLKRNQNQIKDKLKLTRIGIRQGYPVYKLVQV
jgi:hypothetical protein